MTSIANSGSLLVSHLITPEEDLGLCRVTFTNGAISGVESVKDDSRSSLRVDGHILIPGMIDLHINGAGGGDAALGRPEDLERMSRTLARHGCTGYLPTIITDHKAGLLRSLEKLAGLLDADYGGARALGIHLEGPFLSPEKRGVHRPECIQPPSRMDFLDYFSASQERMRILTFAPEMPGGLDLIRTVRDKLPIASMGHTNAGYECAVQAFRNGANLVTHIFNAMASLHHREPGLLGACMVTPGVSVELIADGIHIHPDVVKLLFRAKGAAEVILITDAISAAGMPDGRYALGNLEVEVTDGVCRDEEGRLAGSTLQMNVGLQKLRDWLVITGEEELTRIVATATSQPAELAGLSSKGRIRKGYDADLVLLDSDLRVLKTWVEGKLVYDAATGG